MSPNEQAMSGRGELVEDHLMRLLESLENHCYGEGLDMLALHYGIQIRDRHRAHGDALATARILIRLLDEAGRQGLSDFYALKAFLRKRGKRARPRQGQQLSFLGPPPDVENAR
jgi:DNA polymerase III epsilon subunit-like protein